MRPIVSTKKHLVQSSLFTIASGAIRNDTIIDAKADPAAATPREVTEGSRISAVYVEMWLTSDDATLGTTIVTLEKLPGGQTVKMTSGDAAALNVYGNKKNIFHTQMGLIPNNVSYPMPAVKGWFKIPKSKQRFGLDDRLILNILGQSNGVTGCGFFLFKEQT